VGGGNERRGVRELYCMGWAWDGIAGWHSGLHLFVCSFVCLAVFLTYLTSVI